VNGRTYERAGCFCAEEVEGGHDPGSKIERLSHLEIAGRSSVLLEIILRRQKIYVNLRKVPLLATSLISPWSPSTRSLDGVCWAARIELCLYVPSLACVDVVAAL
jgi:hypothetical protein